MKKSVIIRIYNSDSEEDDEDANSNNIVPRISQKRSPEEIDVSTKLQKAQSEVILLSYLIWDSSIFSYRHCFGSLLQKNHFKQLMMRMLSGASSKARKVSQHH